MVSSPSSTSERTSLRRWRITALQEPATERSAPPWSDHCFQRLGDSLFQGHLSPLLPCHRKRLRAQCMLQCTDDVVVLCSCHLRSSLQFNPVLPISCVLTDLKEFLKVALLYCACK